MGGFTLYVYCMPTKGQTNHTRTLRMADLYTAIAPQIKSTLGAPHYALADFGKGRALFAGNDRGAPPFMPEISS